MENLKILAIGNSMKYEFILRDFYDACYLKFKWFKVIRVKIESEVNISSN